MNAQHTPTPWYVYDDQANRFTITDTPIINDRVAHGTNLIAKTFHVGSLEVDKANAIFIVRAVNSYDELLDTLKIAEEALTEFYGRMESNVSPMMQNIREVIEKAEG